MSGEWHRTSALALGAGIESGAIDPRALTLPCGRDGNGIPVGLMLMAPPGEEERLLRLGAATLHVIAGGA